MKIITWNVNGIRSLQPSVTDVLTSLDADIVMMQEHKCTPDTLDRSLAMIDGHSAYFACSRGKAGYSGTVTYARDTVRPTMADEGLSWAHTKHGDDTRVGQYIDADWTSTYDHKSKAITLEMLDGEGRAVMTQHRFTSQSTGPLNVTIINVYCPNAHPDDDDLGRWYYKLAFQRLLLKRVESILNFGGHVVLGGDLNIARLLLDHVESATIPDFADAEHRRWMNEELCTPDGPLVDLYRHFEPETADAYTCWNTQKNCRATNYGTRIDYLLADQKLVDKGFFTSCKILSSVEGSDHCPVMATISPNFTPLPSDVLPSLATANMEIFGGGKQTKLTTFLTKRKSDDSKNGISSNSVKRLRPLPISQKKQTSLSTFFMAKSTKTSTRVDDDVQVIETSTASASSSTYTSGIPPATGWTNVFNKKNDTATPLWKHGDATLERVTKKEGDNKGRRFYVCRRPPAVGKEGRCGFFKWK